MRGHPEALCTLNCTEKHIITFFPKSLQALLPQIQYLPVFKYNFKNGDFPGDPVVKNPHSNAGDEGSIPGWGTKIPHATGQKLTHSNKDSAQSKQQVKKSE